MKNYIFCIIFLSYSPLNAACKYVYQQDRVISLILGVTAANAPEVTTKCH